MTQKEILTAELKKRGWTEVPGKSSKYAALTKEGAAFFYVGKAGALRYGLTIAQSVPAPKQKAMLLAAHAKSLG